MDRGEKIKYSYTGYQIYTRWVNTVLSETVPYKPHTGGKPHLIVTGCTTHIYTGSIVIIKARVVSLTSSTAPRGGSSTLRGIYRIMPRHIIRNHQISADPYRTTAYHKHCVMLPPPPFPPRSPLFRPGCNRLRHPAIPTVVLHGPGATEVLLRKDPR